MVYEDSSVREGKLGQWAVRSPPQLAPVLGEVTWPLRVGQWFPVRVLETLTLIAIFSFQGPPSSCHGEPQFPISFPELCTVTLVERSKDCSLVERLEDSVVLYQELRGLLLGREECLLKLFQLEEWGSRRVSLRRGKGSGVTTMSLLPHLSTTHLSL